VKESLRGKVKTVRSNSLKKEREKFNVLGGVKKSSTEEKEKIKCRQKLKITILLSKTEKRMGGVFSKKKLHAARGSLEPAASRGPGTSPPKSREKKWKTDRKLRSAEKSWGCLEKDGDLPRRSTEGRKKSSIKANTPENLRSPQKNQIAGSKPKKRHPDHVFRGCANVGAGTEWWNSVGKLWPSLWKTCSQDVGLCKKRVLEKGRATKAVEKACSHKAFGRSPQGEKMPARGGGKKKAP